MPVPGGSVVTAVDRNEQQNRAINNVDALIAYLQDTRENMVFFALNQLKALASGNDANKDLICAKGAVAACIPLLHATRSNMIHDKALRLLRSLSVTQRNQTLIAQEGAIPLLLNFVRGSDPNLQVNAVAILWNLSVHAANKEAIGRQNGVDDLVRLLRETRRDNVRKEVVGALRNLSHHAPNRVRIVRAGGIEPLLDALDSDRVDATTRRHAAVALVQCTLDGDGLAAIKRCGAETVAMLEQTCREIDSQLCAELRQTLHGRGESTRAGEGGGGGGARAGEGGGGGGGAGGAVVVSRAQRGGARSRAAGDESKRQGVGAREYDRGEAAVTGNAAVLPHETTIVRETMANEEMCMPFATDTFGTMQWPAIDLEEKIGSGAYSVVYRGRYNGYPVAVKILNDPLPDDVNRREKMMQEFKLMSMLRHPNCLLYMGSALTPDNRLAIISEIATRGTLKDCMLEVKNMTLRMKFAKDLVQGLNWLSANSVVHRDLKPANVLITADWSARISDLGLALVWAPDCVCMRFKGNVKYSAPEILAVRAQSDRKKTQLQYKYGPQTDVYAFSLILWELVSNEPLFEGIRGKEEITDFVCSGRRPELVPGWPKSLTTLLERAWHHDPQQRVLFPQIQADFSNVMIDFLCPDPVGRRISRDLYLGDEMRRVPYAEFEEAFQTRVGIDLNTGSQCYRRCLQAMVADPHTMHVSFEQWCKCVHWLGSMTPIKDFLNKMVRLFEQPWFYGFVPNKDAKRLLLEQQRRTPDAPGYYLIRFSENWPGSFTIYSVDRQGNTSHRRIVHQYSSAFCVTFDGVAGREFPDLFSLHDECCEAGTCLQGLEPLPGAPYQHFFATHPLRNCAGGIAGGGGGISGGAGAISGTVAGGGSGLKETESTEKDAFTGDSPETRQHTQEQQLQQQQQQRQIVQNDNTVKKQDAKQIDNTVKKQDAKQIDKRTNVQGRFLSAAPKIVPTTKTVVGIRNPSHPLPTARAPAHPFVYPVQQKQQQQQEKRQQPQKEKTMPVVSPSSPAVYKMI